MAIKRIYKDNKGIYGAPRIHHILCIEVFKVSLKSIQRRMTELGLSEMTIKKYKSHSSKKVAEDLENVLNRYFTTTSINEKWVGDITIFMLSKMVAAIYLQFLTYILKNNWLRFR